MAKFVGQSEALANQWLSAVEEDEGLAAAAVTAQIARFALNLTASNMLFLGESYEAMKKNRRP